MNTGYTETDEHVNWRWERRCKIAEQIEAEKAAEAAQLSNIQAENA